MRTDITAAAVALLGPDPGAVTPEVLAGRAERAFEQLERQFSRIIGELGTRTLLARSTILASAQLAWLGEAPVDRALPWRAVCTAMTRQDVVIAARGFACVLASFVGLLDRFIGERLVSSLLRELWPDVFPGAVEETT